MAMPTLTRARAVPGRVVSLRSRPTSAGVVEAVLSPDHVGRMRVQVRWHTGTTMEPTIDRLDDLDAYIAQLLSKGAKYAAIRKRLTGRDEEVQ